MLQSKQQLEQMRLQTNIRQAMTRVLYVEDNLEYANILRMVLANSSEDQYDLVHVDRVKEAASRINSEPFDVILLDLVLPDSEGLDTFETVFCLAPDTPIIVITALDDKEIALQAVREGAQDFRVKGDKDIQHLPRAIQYAIERHRMLQHVRHLSFIDDLTGLLNRRGFLALAHQHLKLAQRSHRELLLFFADLDGLKIINDTFGHQDGDLALQQVSAILQKTFRSSDVIARLGGDEFTVMAVDAVKADLEKINQRLQEHIQQLNASNQRYQLSLSVGAAHFDPNRPLPLDELFVQADEALYQVKNLKKQGQHGAGDGFKLL
jgi:two-component system, cell cycle response regulator